MHKNEQLEQDGYNMKGHIFSIFLITTSKQYLYKTIPIESCVKLLELLKKKKV